MQARFLVLNVATREDLYISLMQVRMLKCFIWNCLKDNSISYVTSKLLWIIPFVYNFLKFELTFWLIGWISAVVSGDNNCDKIQIWRMCCALALSVTTRQVKGYWLLWRYFFHTCIKLYWSTHKKLTLWLMLSCLPLN